MRTAKYHCKISAAYVATASSVTITDGLYDNASKCVDVPYLGKERLA